jgi:putative transposase
MFVTLRGEPYLLWRAVDEHGAELDILVQKRRDKAAAKRFFKRVLRSNPVPRKIVTDQLRSYPAAKAQIPQLANAKHVFVNVGRAVITGVPASFNSRSRLTCATLPRPSKVHPSC